MRGLFAQGNPLSRASRTFSPAAAGEKGYCCAIARAIASIVSFTSGVVL
jgi:hypothetical protein